MFDWFHKHEEPERSLLEDINTALQGIQRSLATSITLEMKIMSQITDWAATEQADLAQISSTLDSIVAGISALDTLITNFQNSSGTLSATDQAALDSIQAASAALVTKAQAISVAPPAPPAAPAPTTT
jgi:ABC-type transporter Mla subunit MlaD